MADIKFSSKLMEVILLLAPLGTSDDQYVLTTNGLGFEQSIYWYLLPPLARLSEMFLQMCKGTSPGQAIDKEMTALQRGLQRLVPILVDQKANYSIVGGPDSYFDMQWRRTVQDLLGAAGIYCLLPNCKQRPINMRSFSTAGLSLILRMRLSVYDDEITTTPPGFFAQNGILLDIYLRLLSEQPIARGKTGASLERSVSINISQMAGLPQGKIISHFLCVAAADEKYHIDPFDELSNLGHLIFHDQTHGMPQALAENDSITPSIFHAKKELPLLISSPKKYLHSYSVLIGSWQKMIQRCQDSSTAIRFAETMAKLDVLAIIEIYLVYLLIQNPKPTLEFPQIVVEEIWYPISRQNSLSLSAIKFASRVALITKRTNADPSVPMEAKEIMRTPRLWLARSRKTSLFEVQTAVLLLSYVSKTRLAATQKNLRSVVKNGASLILFQIILHLNFYHGSTAEAHSSAQRLTAPSCILNTLYILMIRMTSFLDRFSPATV
ncbi:hypothetical protein DL93DRAFT_2171746 [Clavulina sp. PMI_390]|nr:hypothetical protein DL93DRAFT_2171746 [Clavulina sp. PMI_390]